MCDFFRGKIFNNQIEIILWGYFYQLVQYHGIWNKNTMDNIIDIIIFK